VSLPYFNLYPADFEADTSHLTLAEDGAYNRLLRLMWMTPGCSLPDDDAWIMRRMRASAEDYETVVKPILAEFFVRRNGRVTNARLRREFENAGETYKARSAAGKKGGRQKAFDKKANDAKAGLSWEKAGPKQPEPEPEPEPYKAPALQEQPAADFTDREIILEAMGHPATGLTATGRIVGNPADMLEAQRWRIELGLSLDHIVGVISELASRPTYRPPRSFSYFREAMRDRAGLLSQSPLTPANVPAIRKSKADELDQHLADLKARLSVQRLE
jgi:uncharacterized protein YdaU (DUF1376 family)